MSVLAAQVPILAQHPEFWDWTKIAGLELQLPEPRMRKSRTLDAELGCPKLSLKSVCTYQCEGNQTKKTRGLTAQV